MPSTTPIRTPDRYLYIGFLLLIAWAPFPLGSNRVWAWSLLEVWSYLLALIWVVSYLCGRVNFTPAFKRARPVIYILLAWLGWIWLQIIPLPETCVAWLSPRAAWLHAMSPAPPGWITLSVDPYATWSGLLKSITYVLIFCLVLLLVNSRRRLKILAYVLIMGGLFQAVYGSLMMLTGIEYGFLFKKEFGLGFATGTFINRNHLAGYLEMCLAVGIGVMIANLDTNPIYSWKQRLRYLLKLLLSEKFRLRLSLVIIVIALVLTRSRMGNTAFFTSLLIAGGIGLLLSRYARRETVILLVSLIIIDIAIVGTWFGFEQVVDRIKETTIETETRADVAEYAVVLWSDYNLTGSGLGSFYSVFPYYRQQDVSGYFNYAHNDYLQFAGETGIIGIGLLGAVVIGSLLAALRAQYQRRDPLMRGIAFAAIMGIIAILIHSTVDFNLQIPSNAMMFMILLAMAWLALMLERRDQHRR
jgi:O-antigen ligase